MPEQRQVKPAHVCTGLKRVRVSFILTVGTGLLNEQLEAFYRQHLASHLNEDVCATVKAETIPS